MFHLLLFIFFFFFNDPAPTEIYTLSLHDALPIYSHRKKSGIATRRRTCAPIAWMENSRWPKASTKASTTRRSEEHTSELQSRRDLVCRLLLEKKKKKKKKNKNKRKKINKEQQNYQ